PRTAINRSCVCVVARRRTRFGSGAIVTVIKSPIEVSVRRDMSRLHRGTTCAIGCAERRRRGQLHGTEMPHGRASPHSTGPVAIAMIDSALLALAVTPSPRSTRPGPARSAAGRAAIDVAAIARATDREERPAKGAGDQPKVGHVLACADLLP